MIKETYVISFYLKVPNWVSISSIDKKTFYSFVNYLYSLKRNIVVMPYICGGFVGPFRPVIEKDMTYSVQLVVEDIKHKIPIHQMLAHHFSKNNIVKSKYFNIHFNEDVFEYLISLGLDKETALSLTESCKYDHNINEVKYQLTNIKNINHLNAKAFIKWLETKPNIHTSRWEFIYMFRNEFKKYMSDKGYKVYPVGGWVLNDKKRECDLGLIDESGELF